MPASRNYFNACFLEGVVGQVRHPRLVPNEPPSTVLRIDNSLTGRCITFYQLPESEYFMKAIWNGAVIAQSDTTVVLEGNHYFPEASLNRDYVTFSNHHTMCAWKGQASYYSLLVNGEMNADAVWYYPNPTPEAEELKGHVAFWKGVKIEV